MSCVNVPKSKIRMLTSLYLLSNHFVIMYSTVHGGVRGSVTLILNYIYFQTV